MWGMVLWLTAHMKWTKITLKNLWKNPNYSCIITVLWSLFNCVIFPLLEDPKNVDIEFSEEIKPWHECNDSIMLIIFNINIS